MPRHEEHPSKATSWRDGSLVVLEDAEREDCTVWFSYGDGGSEDQWEGLLARRLAPDRARICAVPFWLYDLNLGDEVTVVESGEGALVATGLARDAGAFAYRVVFEGAAEADERWRTLMVELEPYDCWFDVRSPSYVALSCPAQHAQAVADYLHEREQRSELRYETGRRTLPR